MRVLVAPDSFKGTMAAGAVADAICAGVAAAGCEADRCPVADGGEGTLAALVGSGETREATVADPLGRPVVARYGVLDGGATAVVEMAQASGLGRVARHERDPVRASSRGTGELIATAIAGGARTVLVTVGGSATTDGGAGALAAIEAAGGRRGARLVVLCDVTTPFERAATTYGPQKGAGPATVALLAARLDTLADNAGWRRDPRGVPMTGAGGGLAGGLWAALDAELATGASVVLDRLGFEARLAGAAAVITGEGRLDAQSLEGKLVGEVAARARRAGVPAHALVGRDALGPERASALGLASVAEAGDPTALRAAARALARRAARS